MTHYPPMPSHPPKRRFWARGRLVIVGTLDDSVTTWNTSMTQTGVITPN